MKTHQCEGGCEVCGNALDATMRAVTTLPDDLEPGCFVATVVKLTFLGRRPECKFHIPGEPHVPCWIWGESTVTETQDHTNAGEWLREGQRTEKE